jgi:hypothetical protein
VTLRTRRIAQKADRRDADLATIAGAIAALAGELVPKTLDRLDELGMLGVRLDFLPQPGHMHVDSAGSGYRLIAPNGPEQFLA